MRTFAIVAALFLAFGCKGKPKHQAPPKTTEVVGSAAGSGVKAAADIVLPVGPGTPPDKTTKPIPLETFKKLGAMTFPGFQIELRGLDEHGITIRQKTEDHPKIWSETEITPCTDCTPIDLAKWQAKKDALKQFILPLLKDRPETEFTIGETELNGQKMIYTYQVGSYMGPEGGGYTNAYYLYWNDGVNQIRVSGEYKDDPATKEGMQKLAPREDLENVAKAFMDVYTHVWATS